MPGPPTKLLYLSIALAVAAGCKPKIGDDCQISTDCSAAGDRLCDITAPGGYCTVYNCEPGACPEDESLCVQFGSQRSPVAECQDAQSPSPYARSFCMATCAGDSDCREGYVCADLSSAENDWGALVIDRDRGKRACLVPLTGEPVPADGGADAGVCHSVLPGPQEPSASEPGGVAGAGGVPAGAAGEGGSGQGGAGSSAAGSAGQGGADEGGAGG